MTPFKIFDNNILISILTVTVAQDGRERMDLVHLIKMKSVKEIERQEKGVGIVKD